MKSLQDRIAKVIEITGWSRAKLADEAGVSRASVTHWLNGATQELKGPSAANLSKNSGFRAQWLIDGKGLMMSGEKQTAQERVASKPDVDAQESQPITIESLSPTAIGLAVLFDSFPPEDFEVRDRIAAAVSEICKGYDSSSPAKPASKPVRKKQKG